MTIPLSWIISAGLITLFVFLVWRQKYSHLLMTRKHPRFHLPQTSPLWRVMVNDPVSGRDQELERVIHILMRRVKNNPLLIGEPGVGKTAIVEGLAHKIVNGQVPEALKSVRVLSLDLNELMSGTHLRGELEGRLKRLLQMLHTQAKEVMLFIDEIHLLEEMGKTEGALSISDVLKPAMARGDIRIIGATTWQEYEKHIRADQALDRRLQPVLVDEPNPKQALAILRSVRHVYEEFHHVTISDAALEAAVTLSHDNIKRRFLPDKAIDLIDEAGAKVAIDAEREHHIPLGLVHAAAKKQKTGVVEVKDIEEIVKQWTHS